MTNFWDRNFTNLIFGFLAKFWMKFWCDTFLFFKENFETRVINESHQFMKLKSMLNLKFFVECLKLFKKLTKHKDYLYNITLLIIFNVWNVWTLNAISTFANLRVSSIKGEGVALYNSLVNNYKAGKFKLSQWARDKRYDPLKCVKKIR